MALTIGDNFKYQGRKPLDARLVVETKAELLAVPTSTIYDGIKVYVKSEKKFYVYDSTNTSDPVLYKWTEFTVGTGDIEPFDTLAYSKSLTVDLGNDETLLTSDLIGTPAITDIHIGQYLSDKSGILAKVISKDETINEITVRVLTKDTIINTDTVHYTGTLGNTMGNVSTINYTDLDTTDDIADFSTNNLIYDDLGTLAKVLSKDATANTIQVTPVSVDIALSTMDVYKSLKDLDKTIGKQQTLLLTDLDTSKLIDEIDKNQLVYDSNGILAKVDSIFVGDGVTTQSSVTVTTISGSGNGTSIEAYKYLGSTSLDKVAGNRTTVLFTDLDTTKAITDIETNQLVYDALGTLTKIVMIDIPNNQLLLQTLTTSGMTSAPVLKELVISESGVNYQVGDIIQSTTSSVYGEVISVGSNGDIEQVVISTQTTQSVHGTGAVINYETVIYGATGNTWSPLHNTSTQVAQIVSEPFDYQQGYVYTITNPGSGYIVGDVVSIGHNVEVTSVDINGEILSVKYSRNEQSVHGTGASITFTPSSDIFTIPDAIWNNSKQNQFDITNDDGAYTTFNRLDTTTTKYAVGNETVYKFTFDNSNGTITQEKTTLNASGGGIGPFVPQKNYVKDDVIINDNIIYICKDNHTADLSLGADISHWEEMRKTMTSGMRHVTASISISSITTSWTTQSLTYYDGDQSMLNSADKCLVAPQDGLYLINSDASLVDSGSSGKYSALLLNNKWAGFGYAEGTVIPSVASILYLKKNDKITYQAYAGAIIGSSTTPIKITMTLLSDDRSDNLVAEATEIMPSSITASTYTTITYEDSTNLGIINTNGDITLPEDGSYILSFENLMSSTGGTAGLLETMIRKKEDLDSETILTTSYPDCTRLQANGFSQVISGIKGDTFIIRTYRGKAQSGLTRRKTPKVRLFKIKSVDYHLDSHDLHRDSGSELSYEDWIASKLKNSQLTVTGKITTQSIARNIMKLLDISYVSGETSMLSDNKFIAPVSGFYNMTVNGIYSNSDAKSSTIIAKNSTLANWDGIVSYASSLRNISECITYSGWLNKGEYLTVNIINEDTTKTYAVKDTITTRPDLNKVTFTLINTGITSSYDINKPHLWPVDTEIDLGDGLFGYRHKIAQVGSPNNFPFTSLGKFNRSTFKFINWGGSAKTGKYNNAQHILPYFGSQVLWLNTDNYLTLWFGDNSGGSNTNMGYLPATDVDVWVTYTK